MNSVRELLWQFISSIKHLTHLLGNIKSHHIHVAFTTFQIPVLGISEEPHQSSGFIVISDSPLASKPSSFQRWFKMDDSPDGGLRITAQYHL